MVATEDSPEGEPVSLKKLQDGLDLLVNAGEVRIEPATFGGYRRSSALGAMLATLHGVVLIDHPVHIRLAESTPIRDLLTQACTLASATSTHDKVTVDDPQHRLFTSDLPDVLREVIDTESYTVKGSAGQINFLWAETPWVAILDRLVTSSPQRGHYVVYLVHPEGRGIYLSLNQGVTETTKSVDEGNTQVGYRPRLEAQAAQLRGYIAKPATEGLLNAINLEGSGRRTLGYEAANVIALFHAANHIPHDAVLVAELQRFLAAYGQVTESLDAALALTSVDLPEEARSGTESKRYRWHLRAEGRRSSLAQRAKELRNYTCQVCQREFVKELGEMGKRCIDAHHLTPFSELDSHPRKLDPDTDFAVVCSNCHRLLHSKTPPLSPEELVHVLSDTQ